VPLIGKKTLKKKNDSSGKNVQGAGRAASKSGGSKKRRKTGTVDPVRAAILAGSIIAVSAFISSLIIVISTAVKDVGKRPPAGMLQIEQQIEQPRQESPVFEPENPAPLKQQAAVPEGKPAGRESPVETAKTSAQPKQPPAQSKQSPVQSKQPPAQSKQPPVQPKQPPERPQPEQKGVIVFIIDDAGNNLNELEPFLRFPGPLTIAVMPGLPHSAEAARRIRAAGKEVFLHQPMEALGGQYPGPAAIYSGMGEAETLELLKRNINEVGPVAGINNHQGSKITGDREAMETILSFCREQGIFFLDSRTTADTVAPETARRMGMKIGARNIFIDNEQDKAAMRRSINDGISRAQKQGSAVMIGHAWSPALAPLLSELYPGLTDQGYTLSVASRQIELNK
jgi:polysaccharide deacetylase 2 family uncharacterized protein YibQ